MPRGLEPVQKSNLSATFVLLAIPADDKATPQPLVARVSEVVEVNDNTVHSQRQDFKRWQLMHERGNPEERER